MENKILKEIISFRKKEKAEILSRFFKTGKGQYGFGDLFLGITVPKSREIAIKYMSVSFDDIKKLMSNKYHEVRLISLLILVQKYKKSKTNIEKKKIVDLYLSQAKYINNWDLVDLSAHYILGDYIYNNKKEIKIIHALVKSKNLWEKRIAIISTFAFIYKTESKLTFEIVKYLINDKHDLIHKACGWMLREVGKRVNEGQLCLFIDQNYAKMPRTMLRYAIERLPEQKRKYYLNLNR
jgi:3-methyladenine DNA glycosylase AlkD